MEATIHEQKESLHLLNITATCRADEQCEIIAARNQNAFFSELYRQYYPRILAFFRFRIGAEAPAEDLTALVFERALTHLADLKAPEAVGAWLFRIAHNCASNYLQRQRPEVSLDMLVPADHPCTASLEENVIALEDRMNLLARVNQLSDREREVIELKFVARLRNRDIARILCVPEGTVGSLLYRTLGKLRESLQTEGDAG